MLKFFSFGQNKRYKKMPSFFFNELQLITVLTLIGDACVGFSIFDSVSILLKFIFLLNKMHHGPFDFKTS